MKEGFIAGLLYYTGLVLACTSQNMYVPVMLSQRQAAVTLYLQWVLLPGGDRQVSHPQVSLLYAVVDNEAEAGLQHVALQLEDRISSYA